ncbi:MAG: hypothetical protein HY445_02935 [Candidatus Niyogibacteria bacterium]|nr:hypothetical protein [Candidatus Niyogibacteria bacterium]
MKKIFSFLGRRYDPPSPLEIQAIIRRFSRIEQAVFLFFVILLLMGVAGLVWGINNTFSKEAPANRGTWREGVVGLPHTTNPLLALSDTDRDLISLIYAGLMRPDGLGRLQNSLAENYTISPDGLVYTFILKENLTWQDGKPFTTNDIAFTIALAQNPELKSPVRASWEGVNVAIKNDREIEFRLEQTYAPFLENTTLGILPKHIWNGIPIEQLSLSKFNIEPVGAGPYKVNAIERNSSGIITKYVLQAFKDYALGEPFISSFEFRFYPSERSLLAAFEKREINGIAGISPQRLPDAEHQWTTLHALTLPRVFGIFFNQNKKDAFSKQEIREALRRAVDRERITKEVFGGFAKSLFSPIPPGTLGALDIANDPSFVSMSSPEEALRLFERNGWSQKIPGENKDMPTNTTKLTNKKGDIFRFTLATSNVPDLVRTAELLKEMWGALGIEVELRIFEASDLNQNVIRPREYEALLFGEIVGRDPDPFSFWHSSQRNDPGLNIALYTNAMVDTLLEKARMLSDEAERKEKYEAFQKEIIRDDAAIFLYSPLYLYITDNRLKGFNTENITVPAERYANIHAWYLHTKKVFSFFNL